MARSASVDLHVENISTHTDAGIWLIRCVPCAFTVRHVRCACVMPAFSLRLDQWTCVLCTANSFLTARRTQPYRIDSVSVPHAVRMVEVDAILRRIVSAVLPFAYRTR